MGACNASPSDDALPPSDPLAALAAPGPHRAGWRRTTVTYPDPASSEDRTLDVSLWYPTGAEEGEPAAYLFDSRPAPGVLRDAPPADGPHGLVVFSHGAQSYAETSGALMAHLATHGWIVASADHVPDVTWTFASRTTPIYVQRPRDVSAVLDHLLADGEPDLPIDDTQVLGIGHSFGGYTMLALAGAVHDMDRWAPACTEGTTDTFCQGWDPALDAPLRQGFADDRLSTVILMNAGDHRLFGATGLASVDRDVLQITGALDTSVPNDPVGDAIAADLPPGDHLRVDLAHGDHLSLTDFAGTLGLPGADPDALDPARADRIGRLLLTGWAHWRVRGEASAAAVFDDPPFDDDLTITRP